LYFFNLIIQYIVNLYCIFLTCYSVHGELILVIKNIDIKVKVNSNQSDCF
jgi:hypothetical protein